MQITADYNNNNNNNNKIIKIVSLKNFKANYRSKIQFGIGKRNRNRKEIVE